MESLTLGNSAIWTSPLRPRSVADAGCGSEASVVESLSLGNTTIARVGTSDDMSRTDPAAGFQVETARAAVDSAGVVGAECEESTGGLTGLSRPHDAVATSEIDRAAPIRRNRFIRRNLDRSQPASTAAPAATPTSGNVSCGRRAAG